jgi:hypothetical protein
MAAPVGRSLGNADFFEQYVISTHPPPSGATSQGGKAAVFTSSLQNASFATSHLLLPLVAAWEMPVLRKTKYLFRDYYGLVYHPFQSVSVRFAAKPEIKAQK